MIVFSGSRGFHIHVLDFKVRDCMVNLDVVNKYENLLVIGMWGRNAEV